MSSGGQTAGSRFLLRGITVEELFGLYSYSLSLPEAVLAPSRMALLYGDNGSGKTTLLRLIQHTLSAESNEGHRGALSRTPFRAFRLHFTDGLLIEVEREADALVGDYCYRISRPGGETYEWVFTVDDDGSLTPGSSEDLVGQLRSLSLTVHYLADDRRPLGLGPEASYARRRLIEEARTLSRAARADLVPSLEDTLSAAVRSFEQWIRRQTLLGSSRGEEGAHNIYTDIVRRIASAWAGLSTEEHYGREELVSLLREIQEKADTYARFGLVSAIEVGEMVTALSQAETSSAELIARVLSPYVRGISARLEALRDIQLTLATFSRHVNGLFTDKTVAYTVEQGLTVSSRTGQELSLDMLSSGERQLLLLLCSVIPSGPKQRLILIDEPELSLNIKWQRLLTTALLECTELGGAQFIVATHAFEVIAPMREWAMVLRQAGESQ